MGGSLSAMVSGGSALVSALEKQDDEALKEALQANPKLSGCALSMRDGNTASHFAAAEGRLDYLIMLSEAYDAGRRSRGKKHGEKYTARMLNRRNLNGQTALMLACKHGHDEVVTWLLQAGGNPLLFDAIHSRTCLHYAALYGHRSCVAALFSDEAIVKLPQGPLLLRDAKVWDNMGYHGFVDGRASLGFTAMHMAASQGHWQAVAELLKQGASLAVQCQGVLRSQIRAPPRWRPNSTPLHIAAARGSTSMVRHMLHALANQMLRNRHTVDVRQLRDILAMRPVDLAASFGFPRITALLDPNRPPDLLAYVTAGSGPIKLGAPPLSVLMSRLLRSQLLSQLATIERRLAASPSTASRSPSVQSSLLHASSARRQPSHRSPTGPAAQAADQNHSPPPLISAPSDTAPPAGRADPFTASGAVRMLSAIPRQHPRQQRPPSPLHQQKPPLPAGAASRPLPPILVAQTVQGNTVHRVRLTDAVTCVSPQMPQPTISASLPLNAAHVHSNGTAHMNGSGSSSSRQRQSCEEGRHGQAEARTDDEEEEEDAARPSRDPLMTISMRRLNPSAGAMNGSNRGQQRIPATPFANAAAFGDGKSVSRGSQQQARQSPLASFTSQWSSQTARLTAAVREPSFERNLKQALAGLAPGLMRLPHQSDNELVLDERHGDSYTGGRPRLQADVCNDTSPDSNASGVHRLHSVSDADVSHSGTAASGVQRVVVAEMATRQGSVQVVITRNNSALTRAPSNSSVAAEECDICFDAPLQATIHSCRHELCIQCLRGVCEADSDHTPRCPFCRSIIDRILERQPKNYPVPPMHPQGPCRPGSGQVPVETTTQALDDVCDAVIAAQQ